MRRDDIRRMVESNDPATRRKKEQAFVNRFVKLLETKKLKPEDVSIRALWEGLVGPAEDTLALGGRVSNGINWMGMREEVSSTAFPKATGALIASKVIEGYNQVDYIGDDLVTPMPSRLKTETIVGFGAVSGPLDVDEGMPYEDSSINEKYVTAVAQKRGRLISLTEETILHDQTGQLMQRAMRLGEKARWDREKRIIEGVTDVTNVYRKDGTLTTLYATGAGSHANLIASNALVDWTDIDTVMQTVAAQTDENGDRIMVTLRQILVPYALAMTAKYIVGATEIRKDTNPSAGTAADITVAQNPLAGMNMQVLTSPYIDADSSTSWYIGDFKRAFIYQTIWPLQTLAARPGHEDEFNRDIVFKYKVREYGNVACLDHRLVYKCTA